MKGHEAHDEGLGPDSNISWDTELEVWDSCDYIEVTRRRAATRELEPAKLKSELVRRVSRKGIKDSRAPADEPEPNSQTSEQTA
jgi:hypothetical protein